MAKRRIVKKKSNKEMSKSIDTLTKDMSTITNDISKLSSSISDLTTTIKSLKKTNDEIIRIGKRKKQSKELQKTKSDLENKIKKITDIQEKFLYKEKEGFDPEKTVAFSKQASEEFANGNLISGLIFKFLGRNEAKRLEEQKKLFQSELDTLSNISESKTQPIPVVKKEEPEPPPVVKETTPEQPPAVVTSEPDRFSTPKIYDIYESQLKQQLPTRVLEVETPRGIQKLSRNNNDEIIKELKNIGNSIEKQTNLAEENLNLSEDKSYEDRNKQQKYSQISTLSKETIDDLGDLFTTPINKLADSIASSGGIGGSTGGGLFDVIGTVSEFAGRSKEIQGTTKSTGRFGKMMQGAKSFGGRILGSKFGKILGIGGAAAAGAAGIGGLLSSGATEAASSGTEAITKEVAGEGAQAIGKKAASEGVEIAGKTVGKEITEVGGKKIAEIGVKSVGKRILGKTAGFLGKKIPGIGLMISAGLAADKFAAGDYLGAGLHALSGAATTIPVVGTAASLGIDALSMARDTGMLSDDTIKNMGYAALGPVGLGMKTLGDLGSTIFGSKKDNQENALEMKGKSASNLNPGNLRQGNVKDKFIGTTGVDILGFNKFENEKFGIRAVFRDINTKISAGTNTPKDIISKYAPASDNNNQQAYLKTIKDMTGLGPNDVIQPGDEDKIRGLVSAITKQESGADIMRTYGQEGISKIQQSAKLDDEQSVRSIIGEVSPIENKPLVAATKQTQVMIGNEPYIPGQPLSNNQIGTIDLAKRVSPENLSRYSPEIIKQYESQKIKQPTSNSSNPSIINTTPRSSVMQQQPDSKQNLGDTIVSTVNNVINNTNGNRSRTPREEIRDPYNPHARFLERLYS